MTLLRSSQPSPWERDYVLICATKIARSWMLAITTVKCSFRDYFGTQTSMSLDRFAINLQSARDA